MKGKQWIGIVIPAILGAVTLIPAAGASKPCLLGYYAHCTFTPISTLLCWAGAVVAYVRQRKKTQP